MDSSAKRIIAIIAAVIVTGVLLFTTGMVEVASAAQDQPQMGYNKLDVAIYATTNPQGNPIQALPDDDTVFIFHVVWVNTTTTLGGQEISRTTYDLGYFTASQQEPGGFYEVNGTPYKKEVRACTFSVLGVCVWWDDAIEEGKYLIEPYSVPAGYCPQYPSQDRTKETNPSNPDRTTTVNEKFYMGAHCGGLYPGYNGDYANGPCKPHKCYILIQ